jgi:hypothetical protein
VPACAIGTLRSWRTVVRVQWSGGLVGYQVFGARTATAVPYAKQHECVVGYPRLPVVGRHFVHGAWKRGRVVCLFWERVHL